MAQSLAEAGSGAGAWSLWAEHANFKLHPDSLPPSASTNEGPLRLRVASGERTAIQLALRSSGFWGRWRWSGWQTASAASTLAGGGEPAEPDARLSLRQVGFVNITGGTAPYGRVGLMPDPLTPLRLATTAVGDDGDSDGTVFLHCGDKVRPPHLGVQTCVGGQTSSFWLGITVPVGTAARPAHFAARTLMPQLQVNTGSPYRCARST